MIPHLRPALVLLIVFTLVTGLAYPGLVTVIAGAAMSSQVAGSLIRVEDRIVGSALIGQAFAAPGYLHPRPSAANYATTPSGASNLAPTNRALIAAVSDRAAAYRSANGLAPGAAVPIDAVTTSGSGLDPDISPANARDQAARIARARGVPVERVRAVIATQLRGRWLGLFGEPRVNVLETNLALDAALSKASPASKE